MDENQDSRVDTPERSKESSINHDTAAEINFLRTELRSNIDGYRSQAQTNRRRALRFKLAIAAAGGMTTLVLGLKSSPIFASHENEFSALALLLSALVPILTTWDNFHDHHWLWVRFTAAHTALYGVLYDLDYAAAGGDLTKDRLDDIYGKFKSTMEETNSAWLDKRAKLVEGAPTRA
jgi:hypothetical protein